MKSINVSTQNDADYDAVCQIVESCKNLHQFSLGLFNRPKDSLQRLTKAIRNSNIVRFSCGNERFASFLRVIGLMLNFCRTLKELDCSDIVTENTLHQIKDDDWIAFCDGVMSSQLHSITFSTDYMSSEQVNVYLSALSKNNSLKEVNELSFHLTEKTIPVLTKFMNHVENLLFTIITADSTKLLESFANIIKDSLSLRYLNFFHKSPWLERVNLEGEIAQNGFIIGGFSCYNITEMIERNRQNLRRCRASCETLLALKKFCSPKMNLNHDMTKLLSQHLLKTYGDFDAFN